MESHSNLLLLFVCHNHCLVHTAYTGSSKVIVDPRQKCTFFKPLESVWKQFWSMKVLHHCRSLKVLELINSEFIVMWEVLLSFVENCPAVDRVQHCLFIVVTYCVFGFPYFYLAVDRLCCVLCYGRRNSSVSAWMSLRSPWTF